MKRVILSASLSRVSYRNVVQGEEDPALSLDKDLHADHGVKRLMKQSNPPCPSEMGFVLELTLELAALGDN